MSSPGQTETAGAPPVRLLEFALFDSARDSSAKPSKRAWPEWVQLFMRHEVRGETAHSKSKKLLDSFKDGPAVVLGKIAAGESHKDKNVTSVEAMALDIEDQSEEKIGRALEALAPFEFVLYSSHKNGAEAANKDPALRARLRVVLPLAEPVEPARHPALWRALNTLTGNITDPKTKNVGRLFYLPSTFDLAQALAHRNEGRFISAQELLDLAGLPRDEVELPEAEPGSIGKDRQRVKRVLRQMYASETTDDGRDLKAIARHVLAGEPFAEAGDRHNANLAITIWLASKLDPPPSTAAVAEVFANSIEASRLEDQGAPGVEDLIAAWEGAIAKVGDWKEQNKVEEKAKLEAEAEAHQLRNADGPKYETADLLRIAKVAGVEADESNIAQALQRRWIVQAGDSAFYLLASDGGYRGPFGAVTARVAAVEILARAPVMLNEHTRNGKRRRPIAELAEDYGTVSTEVVVDLTRTLSRYDEKARRFYEAARPLRPLLPEFDPVIEQWLRLFAGPQFEKFCDWLACVPDLSKLLCAPYIAGHPGAGKTLIAQGLAKLWSDTPGELDKVLGDFNDEIVRCPMILADETLPRAWKGASITAKLRSILSTLDRSVSRKYLANATLRGAIRLIITANNEFLLSTKDAMSGQDIEAIAQRFLYIDAPEAATRFLESLPLATREAWAQGGIARHTLWLSQNRVVVPGRRFWVEGDVSQMHRMLLISAEWTSRLCEFLVRVLMNPAPFTGRNDGLIRWGKGRLFVNEQGVIDSWAIYFPKTDLEPETAKIGMALRAIANRSRPQMRWRGARYRYREVLIDLLFSWSEAHGIGDRQVMIKQLWDGELPPREPGEDAIEDDSVPSEIADMPMAVNEGSTPF